MKKISYKEALTIYHHKKFSLLEFLFVNFYLEKTDYGYNLIQKVSIPGKILLFIPINIINFIYCIISEFPQYFWSPFGIAKMDTCGDIEKVKNIYNK